MARSSPSASAVLAQVAAALLVLVLGASVPPVAAFEGPWQSQLLKDHPLAGKVLARSAGWREIDDQALARELSGARLVLLGEVHDNPDHHRLKAELLAARLRSNGDKPAALVVEHIRAGQADWDARDATAPAPPPMSADELFRRVSWDKSGWPPSAMFAPLFETALASGIAVLPGDVARETMRSVARGGLTQLAPDERNRLGLEGEMAPPLQAALTAELRDSHCGLMPDSAFGGLAQAQRYRDAHLADAMVRAAGQGAPVYLAAGNGHVRSDRGVPLYLRARLPGVPMAVVVMLEVEEGKHDPADYLPRDPDGQPAADVAIFTPRASRPDPCEEMKARFAKPSR